MKFTYFDSSSRLEAWQPFRAPRLVLVLRPFWAEGVRPDEGVEVDYSIPLKNAAVVEGAVGATHDRMLGAWGVEGLWDLELMRPEGC